jgi:hypothetical protein
MCEAAGFVVASSVVDHIKPHRGDQKLFWAPDNWQALCKNCHDSEKQRIERNGYGTTIGVDGFPIDINHPINKKP